MIHLPAPVFLCCILLHFRYGGGDRKEGDTGYCALTNVDGAHFQIQRQPGGKLWFSWKFRKPGLNYEVATNVQTGLIVWMGGPYCASTANIAMFRVDLMHWLEPGEQVIANDGYGYVGVTQRERTTIAWPNMPGDSNKSRRMKSYAQLRHETVNSRLKMWNILTGVIHEEVRLHQEVFLPLGQLILAVEYSDK